MYETLNIELQPEHRLFICRPEVMDDYSALELLNFLLALEAVAEPFNRLADLAHTAGTFLSSAAIREYAEWRLQTLTHVAPFRAAIIAGSPESEAAANLYATLVKGSKAEVDVFRDPAAAAEWLGVPEGAICVKASQEEHR
jgi:hypothetical protein